jgi:hypothetical protein
MEGRNTSVHNVLVQDPKQAYSSAQDTKLKATNHTDYTPILRSYARLVASTHLGHDIYWPQTAAASTLQTLTTSFCKAETEIKTLQ